jgi:maltooligosyltrehalose synthase
MIKAVREANTYSNWVQTNERYEGACRQFVAEILDRLPDDVPAAWRNVVTGDTLHARDGIYVGDILTAFPVAILPGRSAHEANREI